MTESTAIFQAVILPARMLALVSWMKAWGQKTVSPEGLVLGDESLEDMGTWGENK